jgi:SAM-dependent methyltransferase
MNFKINCPICSSVQQLETINWTKYEIIHCAKCGLDYCSDMIEKEIGGDSSPVHEEGIQMMADVFHKTHDLAFHYVKKRKEIYENILGRNCNTVLEVGCGPGVFYKSWNSLNISWSGIDINPYWKEFGEKNEVPISNESTNSIKEKYDIIMAHQVIEHVEDPISFMKSLKLLLNPGGIIHLELPNQDSFTARLRRVSSILSYDYGFIQPPMHLRAYRKRTIEYLFNDLDLVSRMVFVCANNNKTWGQVREYNLKQKSLYNFTSKIRLGSLLIGLAQLKTT